MRYPPQMRLGAWVSLHLLALIAVLPAAWARDRGADGEFNERQSIHFRLHQDVDIDNYSGAGGSRQFEVSVLEILENAYGSVGRRLGVRPRTRTEVWVYDPVVFDQRFKDSFRFQAAGFFNGAIHVRGGSRVDAQLVRTLHHEYVHAAFEAEDPSFVIPAFANEGIAEWFENLAVGKRTLSLGERRVLETVAAQGKLLPLGKLKRTGFASVPADYAGLAYLQSYATIDHLVKTRGERSLRTFVDEIFRSRSLTRALERSFGLKEHELEAELRSALR
ncbi:MAG: hypothetical protein VX614_07755 [Myxococcota bacterium]|nr:hypothetical protein [Myxococcota bacterium]